MKSSFFASALLACIFLAGCATHQELKTVSSVDLQRYSGKWYEIASLPAWFQKDCHGATAEYTPLPDGRIKVLNQCTAKNGKNRKVVGIARVVPNSENARLKVRFGLIQGDYYIIGLDEKSYQWSIVGHPSRKYLWILSRSPKMDDATYRQLLNIAREKGYTNLDQLRKSSSH
ncbi:MAG: lipocalin family protein [Chthoniobacterales bacterium]